MAKFPVLSQGLKHLPEPRQLQPGEIVITRFKNSMRKYRTDLWVGVVIPQTFGPSRHLNRRPTTAQPTDGPWTTHLKDRMYPLYLPGINMYRYSGLQDIFVLNDKTPNVFKRAKRELEAKVWDDLMRIIAFAPTLDWWLDMAQQEAGSKGKRGREMRIVLPSGSEHYLDDDDADADGHAEEQDEGEDESNESADDYLPDKPATSPSHNVGPDKADAPTLSEAQGANEVSASDNTRPARFSNALGFFYDDHESFAFNDRPCTPGQGSSVVNLTAGLAPRYSGSHPFQQAQWMTRGNFPSFDSKPPLGIGGVSTKEEDIHSASDDTAKRDKTFDMSVRKAFQQIFLNTDESTLLLNAFRGIVTVQHQIEFDKIQSFLTEGEFSPRLIQLHKPPSFAPMSAIPHQIGDQSCIGRTYHLEGISDTNDLEAAILSLGTLYQQARCFELADLIDLITFKLQVAWNSYPALFHLKPLLKITSLIFPDDHYDENTHDVLQHWMLHFFAETYDLFNYDCSDMFWSIMRANSGLLDAVIMLRSGLISENPRLYSDPQALIRSRGIAKL
ncbi:hypothetical protein N7499_010035 [Penicillium canescens]|nr:hypothetical protein N7499_010035 [Penicillium canescens]